MRFPSITLTCCMLSLFLTTSGNSAETRYYPVPSQLPLEVGAEDIRENFLTLRGLEGLHVDLSVVMATGQDNGINIPESLARQVQDKIESAGLFFLSRDEMLVTPGQPLMSLWPAYEGGENAADPTIDVAAVPADDSIGACPIPVSCKNTVWASFEQTATLLRQPENQYRLNTWGDGDESEQCEDRGNWMAEAVLRKIDFFIADYKKAQQQLTPIVVAKTSDVPEHCSQSWVTHLDVFATNASKINSTVKPIFDKLTAVAKRCDAYSYIIETHADQRANTTYNKLLTEARARSIKDYLLSQGMPYQRIKMHPLGESAPLTNGSSDADHAKNRRVIIKPVKHQEFQHTELDY